MWSDPVVGPLDSGRWYYGEERARLFRSARAEKGKGRERHDSFGGLTLKGQLPLDATLRKATGSNAVDRLLLLLLLVLLFFVQFR